MTPATSVTFFRPEFGDFLYTSIRADSDDMPLSVLSALARLGMDPWKEAAELTELSADAARERLSQFIARLPGERWAQTHSVSIVARLVELLPHDTRSKETSPTLSKGLPKMIAHGFTRNQIVVMLGTIALIVFAISYGASTRASDGEAPSLSSTSQPR